MMLGCQKPRLHVHALTACQGMPFKARRNGLVPQPRHPDPRHQPWSATVAAAAAALRRRGDSAASAHCAGDSAAAAAHCSLEELRRLSGSCSLQQLEDSAAPAAAARHCSECSRAAFCWFAGSNLELILILNIHDINGFQFQIECTISM